MADPFRTLTSGSRDVRRLAYVEVAERVGGGLVEGKIAGGIGVSTQHEGFTLTLSLHPVQTGTVSTMHTRVVVLFSARERLSLTLRPRGFMDRVGERLGFRGLRVGGRAFGERYVVRGRPDNRVRSVMSAGFAAAVQGEGDLMVRVTRASLRHRREWGPSTQSLEVLVPRMDPDVDRMVGMFRVSREGIDVLVRVGIASAVGPR